MSCCWIASPFILQPIKFPNHSKLTPLIKSRKTLTLICSAEQKDSRRNDGPKKPIRRNPRKRTYGASRRSVLKKSLIQEQVDFSGTISDDPVVAIIGGGMSGLVCALNLEKLGIRSTVFDTGIHGLGGRLGTRTINYEPESMTFDHAAQFFTVGDPKFAELTDEWFNKGLIRQWEGKIGNLDAENGGFVSIDSLAPRYIAVNGMRTLADSILSESRLIDVVRPCWISTLEPFNGMWHVSENGKPRGQFDAVVIAHNGKCANRLLSSSGLPLIARQMKRLELSSIWALLAAFEDPLPLPVPFEGAFVKGIESLSWMANNTKKFKSGGPDCWTFFSTASFAKRNKVPQENIPNVTAERVKETMLEGVEKALGLAKNSIKKPFYSRVQLWGAALPVNSPGIPCIFDPHGRAGICGDWLLGSSLESAALSGAALASQISDYFRSGGERPDEFAVGLDQEFHTLKGHDIGQFPGFDPIKEPQPQPLQLTV